MRELQNKEGGPESRDGESERKAGCEKRKSSMKGIGRRRRRENSIERGLPPPKKRREEETRHIPDGNIEREREHNKESRRKTIRRKRRIHRVYALTTVCCYFSHSCHLFVYFVNETAVDKHIFLSTALHPTPSRLHHQPTLLPPFLPPSLPPPPLRRR